LIQLNYSDVYKARDQSVIQNLGFNKP